jgi:hypothetical protein
VVSRLKNSNYFNLKYLVFPCILDSTFPSASSLRSLSRVGLSSSPTSSAISAAGSQGLTDRILIAIINSLSVCWVFPRFRCFDFIVSQMEDMHHMYICLMLLVTFDAIFIYMPSHITLCENKNETVLQDSKCIEGVF